jgi:hypothetical protein
MKCCRRLCFDPDAEIQVNRSDVDLVLEWPAFTTWPTGSWQHRQPVHLGGGSNTQIDHQHRNAKAIMTAPVLTHEREVLRRQRGKTDQLAFIVGKREQLKALRRREQFTAGHHSPRRAKLLVERFAADPKFTGEPRFTLTCVHAAAKVGDPYIGQ